VRQKVFGDEHLSTTLTRKIIDELRRLEGGIDAGIVVFHLSLFQLNPFPSFRSFHIYVRGSLLFREFDGIFRGREK